FGHRVTLDRALGKHDQPSRLAGLPDDGLRRVTALAGIVAMHRRSRTYHGCAAPPRRLSMQRARARASVAKRTAFESMVLNVHKLEPTRSNDAPRRSIARGLARFRPARLETGRSIG